ncbi:MAG: hypothetical protein RIE06_31500 [Roseibium album]|uniref:hypothetical protein n=1 Tax=Roseibium album TaxID=311410 RepID=UPI0032F04AFA
MSQYRKVSWKRNIRRIPDTVLSKLREIEQGSGIVPVCTKRVAASDLQMGMYEHLGLSLQGDDSSFLGSVLPPTDSGVFSTRNRHGWEIRRTDLPMISKDIYLGERPIYGDWSNGSFSLWQQRQVYQTEEYGPTDYSIEIELLRRVDDGYLFKFALDCTLDRDVNGFDVELLFCLNLLQENTGSCGIESSAMSREDYIATTLVDWEIFPPGSFDRFLAKAKSNILDNDPKTNRIIEERVNEFRRLSPDRYILGKGGFNRYIGAVLPNGVVSFENIRYGNALYVLYEDWEEVSQRSRRELLQGTNANYERIPHAEGWVERFRKAVREKRA